MLLKGAGSRAAVHGACLGWKRYGQI